jgi:hypothetical protein
VTHGLFNLSLKVLSISNALFNVSQILLFDYSLDKTANNFDGINGLEANVEKTVRSNSNKDSLSNEITELEVLLGGPVVLGISNISEDFIVMFDHVNLESFSKFFGIFEDGSELSNLGNVAIDILATVKISGELLEDCTNLLDSSEDVLETSLFKIIYGDLDLISESLRVLDASLDFAEVVLLDDSVHKSSNDLNGVLSSEGLSTSG